MVPYPKLNLLQLSPSDEVLWRVKAYAAEDQVWYFLLRVGGRLDEENSDGSKASARCCLDGHSGVSPVHHDGRHLTHLTPTKAFLFLYLPSLSAYFDS